MKKAVLAIVIGLAMLSPALTFSACSVFEKDITVVLNNMGEIQNTYTVNIFKNAVLADIKTDRVIGVTQVEEDGVMVEKNVEFLGWHPDEGASNGMIKAKGLARYAELKEWARKGVVVLYAIYGVKVIEKHDLIIAWYARTLSGLSTAIMDNYSAALFNWLEKEGFSEPDAVLRSYTGDVFPSCEAVRDDGGADIMLGWGNNLNQFSGNGGHTACIERQGDIPMGSPGNNRYVDLIRETSVMFDAATSLSRKVFEWTVANKYLFL